MLTLDLVRSALFQFFLVVLLAISGVASFRLPSAWTQQPNRIEAPAGRDLGSASCCSGEQQLVSGYARVAAALAIVGECVSTLALRCPESWLLDTSHRARFVPSVHGSTHQARAPPLFVRS